MSRLNLYTQVMDWWQGIESFEMEIANSHDWPNQESKEMVSRERVRQSAWGCIVKGERCRQTRWRRRQHNPSQGAPSPRTAGCSRTAAWSPWRASSSRRRSPASWTAGTRCTGVHLNPRRAPRPAAPVMAMPTGFAPRRAAGPRWVWVARALQHTERERERKRKNAENERRRAALRWLPRLRCFT